MRPFVSIIALGLVLASCGPEPSATDPSRVLLAPEKPGEAPETRADGRLPTRVRPLRYELDLEIDPQKERFRGTAKTTVEVSERTFHVVMHARDMTVARAYVRQGSNAATVTSRVAHGGHAPEEIVLTFVRPLEKGTTEITMEYDAPFARDLAGLYRVSYGGAWYAYTQFEPTDARRMFPCFDEPMFKVPFDVTVAVPKGMTALANAPEMSRANDGGATRFRFLTTKPLPTYLVALAVGDFDIREGPREPVPIRLVAPKGKGELGQLAIDAALALNKTLAEYFGVPHPYPKLDIVAVPELAAGAMENPGLVTFREELVLLEPRHASTRARRALALVMAHELAHQWFGNLVTAEWWNDLWLNEAMATWMQTRAVDTWQPQFGARLEAVSSTHHVMDLDALASARAVRQPVTSTGEAHEAFDGLTYTKGAGVLAMIERWLGKDMFQAGVREYLRANAWKSAKAESLLLALDKVSRKDVSAMAATFLDRPGVPMVTAHLECEPAGRWNVALGQEPWRSMGSTAEDTRQAWTVPVCVQAEGRKGPFCALMAAGAPSLVAGTGKCPAWIHPNEGSVGYYRFAENAPELSALAHAAGTMDGPSRFAIVSDMWAAARAGVLGVDQAIKILPLFDKENDRVVLDEIVQVLQAMSDVLVEEEARLPFRYYVAARLARHKKTVGWTPEPKDDDDRRLLRRTILFAMADLAEDAATLSEAEPFARAWLRDPASVDSDTAQIAVELASRRAGADRLLALRAAAKNAKTPQDRLTALRGMVSFDDSTLLESALDLFLTDEIKAAEARYVFGVAAARRASKRVFYEWIVSRWDKLRVKLPGSLSARLVGAAAIACTRSERDAAEAFFGARMQSIEGAARPFAEALESATLCAELRAKGSAAVTKALRKM